MNTATKPIIPIKPSTLMEAFIQAQKEIEPNPTFDMQANTGKFSYPYLSLGRVLEIVRGPLSKHGISIQQFVHEAEGKLMVVTRLTHVSGEAQDFYMPLYGVSQNPQDFGKAFTYARRYALYGIFGIYGEEDDDANSLKPESADQQRRLLLAKIVAAIGKDDIRRAKVLGFYKVKDFYQMSKDQMEHCLNYLNKSGEQDNENS